MCRHCCQEHSKFFSGKLDRVCSVYRQIRADISLATTSQHFVAHARSAYRLPDPFRSRRIVLHFNSATPRHTIRQASVVFLVHPRAQSACITHARAQEAVLNRIVSVRCIQARNRSTNHIITFGEHTMCEKSLAEEYGVNCKTLRSRLKNGWSLEEALTIPVRHHKPYQPRENP